MCSARTGSVCRGNYWRWVPLPPSWIHHRRGGSTTSTAKAAAMRGGGRAGAATSRMTAIAEGGIRRGRTHPWRRRTTMTAMSPAQACPSPSHTIKQRQRRGGGGGGGEEEEAPVDDGICCMAGRGRGRRGGRRQLLQPAAQRPAGGSEARAPDKALRGGPSPSLRTTGRWSEEEDQEDG